MALALEGFEDIGLSGDLLEVLLADHEREAARLDRLWSYYRNPLRGHGTRRRIH